MSKDHSMNAPVTDETLMALADGELAADEAARLRALMAHNPALAERFADFAESRALLGDADAAAKEDDAGLARLAASIRAAGGAPQRRFGVVDGGKAESAPPRPSVATVAPAARRPAMRFNVLPSALAASLALVIGGAIGFGLGQQGSSGPATGGGIVAVANAPGADAALTAALERQPSGSPVVWTDAGSGLKGAISVIATHKLDDGRVCREYEATVAGRDAKAVGVGCRDAGGEWRTEFVARAASGDASYGTASGGAGMVENALTELGGGGALPESEERALLARGWAAPKE